MQEENDPLGILTPKGKGKNRPQYRVAELHEDNGDPLGILKKKDLASGDEPAPKPEASSSETGHFDDWAKDIVPESILDEVKITPQQQPAPKPWDPDLFMLQERYFDFEDPYQAIKPKVGEDDGKPKVATSAPKNDPEKVLGFLESAGNSGQNILTSFEGIIPRMNLTAADVWEGVLGRELTKSWYNLEGRDLDQVRSEAYKKLDALEAQVKPTEGIISSVASGSPSRMAAGVVDAMSALVSTALPSMATYGGALFTEMVGTSIHSYNTAKAEMKGKTVDQLYADGEAELTVPLAAGAAGMVLEKIGLKGVTNAMNRRLAGPAAKKVAEILVENNQEGLTEWIQDGIDEYAKATAQGKSAFEAADAAVKSMVSEHGAEVYLKGAVGSGAAGAAGRAGKNAIYSKESRANQDYAAEVAETKTAQKFRSWRDADGKAAEKEYKADPITFLERQVAYHEKSGNIRLHDEATIDLAAVKAAKATRDAAVKPVAAPTPASTAQAAQATVSAAAPGNAVAAAQDAAKAVVEAVKPAANDDFEKKATALQTEVNIANAALAANPGSVEANEKLKQATQDLKVFREANSADKPADSGYEAGQTVELEATAKTSPEAVTKLPGDKKLLNDANPEVTKIGKVYAQQRGLPEIDTRAVASLDVDRSKTIGDAYEAMQHDPENPEVKKAYQAMKDETKAQWDTLTAAGYVMEPWHGEGEPYANSQEMVDDVRKNKHVWFFQTEKGFGEDDATWASNPLTEETDVQANGKPLLYNDLFRAVHDVMGHAKIGNQFGAIGEENAWRIHSQMYTPEARRAMTTETRGQNSWVNFGPHMRNPDGSIKKKGDPGYLDVRSRPFAQQKVGLLPAEFTQVENVDNEVQKGTGNQSGITSRIKKGDVLPVDQVLEGMEIGEGFKALLDYGKRIKLNIHFEGRRQAEPLATYTPSKDKIAFNINHKLFSGRTDREIQATIAHELIHKIIKDQLGNDDSLQRKEMNAELIKLRDHLEKQDISNLDPNTQQIIGYALSKNNTPEELITYGLTNPEFAAFLANTRYGDGTGAKSTTAWAKVKEYIMKYVSNVLKGNALDEVNRILDKYVSDAGLQADPGAKAVAEKLLAGKKEGPKAKPVTVAEPAPVVAKTREQLQADLDSNIAILKEAPANVAAREGVAEARTGLAKLDAAEAAKEVAKPAKEQTPRQVEMDRALEKVFHDDRIKNGTKEEKASSKAFLKDPKAWLKAAIVKEQAEIDAGRGTNFVYETRDEYQEQLDKIEVIEAKYVTETKAPKKVKAPKLSPDDQIAAGKAKLAALLSGKTGKAYDVVMVTAEVAEALGMMAVGYIRKGFDNSKDFVRIFRKENPEAWEITGDDLEQIFNKAKAGMNGQSAETKALKDASMKKVGKKKRKNLFGRTLVKNGIPSAEVQERMKAAGLTYNQIPNAITRQQVNALFKAFNPDGNSLAGYQGLFGFIGDLRNGVPFGARSMVADQLVVASTKIIANTAEPAHAKSWEDFQFEVALWKDERGREFGQFNQATGAFLNVFELHPKVAARRMVSQMEADNTEKLNRKRGDGATIQEEIDDYRKEIDRLNREVAAAAIAATKAPASAPAAPATPKAPKPSYGSENKIVSKSRYEQLKNELNSLAFAGLDPRYVTLGVYHLEAGSRKFGAFSKKMIADLGDRIKPKLREIYREAANEMINNGQATAADFIQKSSKSKDPQAPHEVLAERIMNRLQGKAAKPASPEQRMLDMLGRKVEEKLGLKRTQAPATPEIMKVAESLSRRDEYSTVWEDTKAELTDRIENDLELSQDPALQQAMIAALDDFYNEFIGQPFSDKSMGKVVQEEKLPWEEVVTSHFTDQEDAKRSLVDKLVQQAGLPQAEALELAAAVTREFNRRATEAKTKYLTRALAPKIGPAPRKVTTMIQQIVKATNAGAISNSAFTDLFKEKFGLTVITPETEQILQDFQQALLNSPSQEAKKRKMVEIADYLETLNPSTRRNLTGWLTSVYYAHILSGFTTFGRNLKGLAMTVPAEVGVEYIKTAAQHPQHIGRFTLEALKAMSRGASLGKTIFGDIMRDGFNYTTYKMDGKKMVGSDPLTKFMNRGLGDKNIGEKVAHGLLWLPVKMVRALAATDAMMTHTVREYKLLTDAYNDVFNDGKDLDDSQKFWDNVYERYNGAGFTEQQARAQVLSENPNATEAQIKKRILEIRDEQIDAERMAGAVHFAQTATLNNDPVGGGAVVYKTLSDLSEAFTGAKLVIPIIRIPTNAMAMFLSWNPVWALKRMAVGRGWSLRNKDKFKSLYVAPTAESRIRDGIKAAISMTAYAALASMVLDDDDDDLITITADGYGDYKKNQSLANGDWQEYSVKIGGRWYSYKDNPLGMMLSSIGYMRDGKKYQDMGANSKMSLMTTALMNSFLFIKEQSYVQTLTDFSAAMEKGGSGGGAWMKALEQLAVKTARIPIANVYQQAYKNMKAFADIPNRDTSTNPKDDFGQAFLEDFINHAPFLESTVSDVKVDALGKPVVEKFMIPFIPDRLVRSFSAYKGEKHPEWMLINEKKYVMTFAEPEKFKSHVTGKPGEPISPVQKREIQRLVAERMGKFVNEKYDKLKGLNEERFKKVMDKRKEKYTEFYKEQVFHKK